MAGGPGDGAVPEVAPDEAEALLGGGALLLDVREADEWAAGHAPSARWLPLGELGARAGEVPKDATVVVVCRSGGRSLAAATALASAGWQALNLTGGMQAWRDAGHPVVTDSGEPGAVV